MQRRFPHKQPRLVSNGLKPTSIKALFTRLPVVFQREASSGLDATYLFAFTGEENCAFTVEIRNKTLVVHFTACRRSRYAAPPHHTYICQIAQITARGSCRFPWCSSFNQSMPVPALPNGLGPRAQLRLDKQLPPAASNRNWERIPSRRDQAVFSVLRAIFRRGDGGCCPGIGKPLSAGPGRTLISRASIFDLQCGQISSGLIE